MSESTKLINESENAKLFRTRMDIFVLNALNEKDGQGYGYDVISYIQEHTKGHYKIKSISTIYNILKRLESAGYVSTVAGDNESYGAARVYYALTPAGREYLEQDKKEWKYIRTLLDNLVSDEEFDLDNEEPPYSASVLKPLTKRTREGGEQIFSQTDNVDEKKAEPYSESEPATTIDPKPISSESDANPHFYNYAYDDDVAIIDDLSKENNTDKEINSFGESAAKQYSAAFDNYKKNHEINDVYKDTDTENENTIISQPDPPLTSDVDFLNNVRNIDIPTYRPQNSELKSEVKDDIGLTEDVLSTDTTNVQRDFSSLSPYIFNLKKNLEKEGYVLHTFNANEKPHTIRYFFSNKILRDMSFASFLYLVVTLLLTNLLKNIFGVSLNAMHTIAAVGMAFVLIIFISYLHDPKKKKKDAVNLKLLNSVLVLIYIVCYMAIAAYYLFTSRYSFYSPQMYAPAIILSAIPFSGLMYSILYLSGKYFQK